MHAGLIESTRVPRNPLDVLAQQIVAMCAVEQLTVDEVREVALGAYPFAECTPALLEGVLDMLAGRYPSDEFAGLRPRVVWDRTAGNVRARPDARRLAVTSGGTIPDRGLYGVFLADSGARVGRPPLGSSTRWRRSRLGTARRQRWRARRRNWSAQTVRISTKPTTTSCQ